MKRLTLSALALTGVVALAGCSDTAVAPETSLEPVSTADQRGAGQMPGKTQRPGSGTIAEIADDAGLFTLLLAAVDYIAETNPDSELVEKLLDRSQITVFAPTDQAFEDLLAAVGPSLDPSIDNPFAAIDDLLGEGTIENVVAYHTTPGGRGSNSVVPRNRDRRIRTLLDGASFSVSNTAEIKAVGNTTTFFTMDGEPLIDISASNGVIHVINAVLLPVDLEL